MKIDLKQYFKKYESIVAAADRLFANVQKDFPDGVQCKIKCSDCCHALFDLTLIEAIYINHKFNEIIKGKEKERLLEQANRIDRKTYMIKRKAYQQKESGKKDVDILVEMAAERVRCPLLNKQDVCDLYEYRPITCRLYGIPTSIGGIGHTCGKSGFVEGQSYPTVNLDMVQKQLYQISTEFVSGIKTRYMRMAEMLVPVSMAILTDYDENYLGIKHEKETVKQ